MKALGYLKLVCEYLGGSCEVLRREDGLSSVVVKILSSGWFRGLLWGVLAGLILLFCGQTSKFIYIDF